MTREDTKAEKTSKRGLIIPPRIQKPDGRYSLSTATLDLQQLRFYLLFWDELAFSTNMTADCVSPEIEFLQGCGILRKSTAQRVRASVNNEPEFLDALREHLSHRIAVNEAWQRLSKADDPLEGLKRIVSSHPRAESLTMFRALSREQPGMWSLGVGPSDPALPDKELMPGRGILFTLFNALPVPDQDTPLHDILEFRNKRDPELLALRVHLERIYQQIVQSSDPELALQTEIDDLQLALRNFTKVAKGARFKLRLCSFEAKIDVSEFLSKAIDVSAKAVAGHYALGAIGALVGAASSFVKIETGVGLEGATEGATPYEYISRYHDEVF